MKSRETKNKLGQIFDPGSQTLRNRALACIAIAALVLTVLQILFSGVNAPSEVPLLRPPSPMRTIDLSHQEAISTMPQHSSELPAKTILLWTPYFNSYKYYKTIFSRITEKECPVSSCRITTDRDELKNAGVVVFHLGDISESTALPKHRPLNQPWLVFAFEAPPQLEKSVDFGRLSGVVVNWTMSYRLDSDVVAPYGAVIKRDVPDYQFADRDFWSEKNKNKMAIWMSSHCHTHSRREEFISELRKYINVDIYGKCGPKSCGKSLIMANHVKGNDHDCDGVVGGYFFYMAFENALCKDYVTEKFYLALTRPVVPVVFGGADYAALAPPRSYINALEYASPKHLAQNLLAIAANKTAYNSYFEWKMNYTIDLGHPFRPLVCDLCAKLHGVPGQHSDTRQRLGRTEQLSNEAEQPISDAKESSSDVHQSSARDLQSDAAASSATAKDQLNGNKKHPNKNKENINNVKNVSNTTKDPSNSTKEAFRNFKEDLNKDKNPSNTAKQQPTKEKEEQNKSSGKKEPKIANPNRSGAENFSNILVHRNASSPENMSFSTQSMAYNVPPRRNVSARPALRDLKAWFLSFHPCRSWHLSPQAGGAAAHPSDEKTN